MEASSRQSTLLFLWLWEFPATRHVGLHKPDIAGDSELEGNAPRVVLLFVDIL